MGIRTGALRWSRRDRGLLERARISACRSACTSAPQSRRRWVCSALRAYGCCTHLFRRRELAHMHGLSVAGQAQGGDHGLHLVRLYTHGLNLQQVQALVLFVRRMAAAAAPGGPGARVGLRFPARLRSALAYGFDPAKARCTCGHRRRGLAAARSVEGKGREGVRLKFMGAGCKADGCMAACVATAVLAFAAGLRFWLEPWPLPQGGETRPC